uniref:Uncharacterized protein n=1 Tax=Amphimedon queenslandica TaxID=400682 RepID=A0A1X7TWN5_AMPQE
MAERIEELITAMENSRKAIKDMQSELRKNKDEVADSVARRVKQSLPLEFWWKDNKKQYKFNEELAKKLEEAATELQSVGDVLNGAEGINVSRGMLEKAKESIKQGTMLVQECQKSIRMADRSEYSWNVVQEYQSDELAANSEDEKCISMAEKVAEQRIGERKRVQQLEVVLRDWASLEAIGGGIVPFHLCCHCMEELLRPQDSGSLGKVDLLGLLLLSQ